YDSFLTDITDTERMDRVYSYGYAMGYIGGSTIPFIMSIALIMLGEKLGVSNTAAVKLSVVLTTVWWVVFSIPFMKNVRQVHYVDAPPSRLASHALANLKKTVKEIFRDKKLFTFVIAYFFYIDGVGTVIHMATSYGSTLGLGTTGMILALLVTQLVAVPFSIIFSRLASFIGSINMLKIGIAIYITVCVFGFYMGFSLEPHQFSYEDKFESSYKAATAGLTHVSTEDLDRIRLDTRSILSASDRAESFTAIIDPLIDSSTGQETRAELGRIKTGIYTFLNDKDISADYEKALSSSSALFWVLALLVGTSQGGMQALSRSFFGKLIPPERSNEFFGFFDIFGKFAAVIGPALYAMFASLTGRSSIGILSLIALFIAGGIALTINGKVKTENINHA
ncbi:MAG: MFS transporter, partial [Eubacteriales bacterium]|nr:MFS transporter [Eubacteriales bacterium]